MDSDALIRSICLRDRHYMFFLGAGASASSGIPTAAECIWQWKQSLFLTQNGRVDPRMLGSVSLPHVQQRIQRWLDGQGVHPKLWDDAEYAHYVEACFPLSADRQEYFRNLSKRSQPHLGYQLLGLLLESGRIKWVWTTNFDDLVDRGRPAARRRPFLQVGMDSRDRLDVLRRDADDAVEVFLHGDYRYDPLINTERELQSLDASCREHLHRFCHDYPVVMLGYSGRDNSVMSALEAAYSTKGKGALYWGCIAGTEPILRVVALLEKARQAGNRADVFYINSFDDFFVRLARYWFRESPEHSQVESLLSAHATVSRFEVNHLSPDHSWILGNGYPITLPGQLYEFATKNLPERGAWKKLRELVLGKPVVAGLLKGKALAIGRTADIEDALASIMASKVKQVTLAEHELTIRNGVVRQIMLSAVTRSLAQRGLEQIGRYRLGAAQVKTHVYRNRRYEYTDSVELAFDTVDGQTFLVTLPDIHLVQPDKGPLAADEMKAVKRDILWRQRNREYVEAVKTWRRLLLGSGTRIVFPPGAETGFEFNVTTRAPVCARNHAANPAPTDPDLARRFAPLEKFTAFSVSEPLLRFAGNDQGRNRDSIHPIKGLVDCGGPVEVFDRLLHRDQDIRLGVVCTEGHESLLYNFLSLLNVPARVGQHDEPDYLVDFPGFRQAFKCNLVIPGRGDAAWANIPRLPVGGDATTMSRRATELVGGQIRRLESIGVDVIIVYVPTAWSPFERVVTDAVCLDLHDQIKALAVQRHQRTQLIREVKVRNESSPRLRWWLSLALFTKSLRVPWMLEPTKEKVAYAGIGYAVDESYKGGRIVLGCSHVFNSAGIGMRFRLSELHDPTWKTHGLTRQRNPYMSRDDAYQLGVRTRQLFYESQQDVPERVMVCKQTPFLEAEIEGLLTALHGIGEVDLLTVEHEGAWRFCAYDDQRQEAHGYPVRRGTGMILDDSSMLLWLHGNVIGVKGDRRSYFQGKSRIPSPVRVTRYSGGTPVETIAQDLAGLTKMDWNTFALYKSMPVTVTTPAAIAKIARLLERLPAESYDYRLFM